MKSLGLIGVFSIIVAAGMAGFFFGGFYDIGGTRADLLIVAWSLEHIRASVTEHAVDEPPSSINDSATIQAGARAFASRACASCHGAPASHGRNSVRGHAPPHRISRMWPGVL